MVRFIIMIIINLFNSTNLMPNKLNAIRANEIEYLNHSITINWFNSTIAECGSDQDAVIAKRGSRSTMTTAR